MKQLLNRLDNLLKRYLTPEQHSKLGEMVRFGMVGAVATMLQLVIYWITLPWTSVGIANTIGYAISFCFNFIASTRFTFRVKANAAKGAGFALSHLINYLLQMGSLTFFVWLGVPERWAPIPMFAICIPVNFLLVRFFLTKK